MNTIPLRLFIADDHQLFAHSLKLMIEEQTAYRVIKIVANGRQLLHALNDERPDLLILDINMPELDGTAVLPRIRLLFPEIRILVVSYLKEKSFIQRIKEMGAHGYFIKDADPDLFLDALKQLVAGEKYFPASARNTDRAADNNFESISQYQFTDREMEVLKLIKANYTSQQISALLFVSENTVKTHRKNICRKLNTSDMKVVYKFAIDHI